MSNEMTETTSNQIMSDRIRADVRARQGVMSVDLEEGETDAQKLSAAMNGLLRSAAGRYPAAGSDDEDGSDETPRG
jgi:hypothetical protein